MGNAVRDKEAFLRLQGCSALPRQSAAWGKWEQCHLVSGVYMHGG